MPYCLKDMNPKNANVDYLKLFHTKYLKRESFSDLNNNNNKDKDDNMSNFIDGLHLSHH